MAFIEGNSGNNRLLGTTGADTINGLAGNDTIRGFGGQDLLTGGSGRDQFQYFGWDATGDTIDGGGNSGFIVTSGVVDLTAATISSIDSFSLAESSAPNVVKLLAKQLLPDIAGNRVTLISQGDDTFEITLGTRTEFLINSVSTFINPLTKFIVHGDSSNDIVTLGTKEATVTGGGGDDILTRGTKLDGGRGDDRLTMFASSQAGPDSQAIGGGGHDELNIFGQGALHLSVLDSIERLMFGLSDLTLTVSGASFAGTPVEMVIAGAANDNFFEVDATLTAGVLNFSILVFEQWSSDDRFVVNYGNAVTQIVGTTVSDLVKSDATNSQGVLIDGGEGNDSIWGGTGADTLYAGEGNDSVRYAGGDVVYGEAGNDRLVASGPMNGLTELYGGTGDDLYTVSRQSAQVIEQEGEGNDTVEASFSIAVPNEVEHLKLYGAKNINGTGNAADNTITGNRGINLISGGEGNDTLSGGGSRDTLDGGAGADTFLVGSGDDPVLLIDNADDVIVPTADRTGLITVIASIDFTLSSGATRLVLSGNEALNGTGSDLSDTITGNGAENLIAGGMSKDRLEGKGGDDTIEGGLGNDRLNGGSGADRLVGDAGSDTYYMDSLLDEVVEGADQGVDTIVTNFSFTLAGNFERLILHTGFDIDGTGNDSDNVMFGNEFSNLLSGREGDDVLVDGYGNDTLRGGEGRDMASFSHADEGVHVDLSQSGPQQIYDFYIDTVLLQSIEDLEGGDKTPDKLIGDSGNNLLSGLGSQDRLVGGVGDDTLIGGEASDTMSGGVGSDTFAYVDSDDSRATGPNRDVIIDFVQGEDVIDLSAIDPRFGNPVDEYEFIGNAKFSHAAQVRFIASGGKTLVFTSGGGESIHTVMAIVVKGIVEFQEADFVL